MPAVEDPAKEPPAENADPPDPFKPTPEEAERLAMAPHKAEQIDLAAGVLPADLLSAQDLRIVADLQTQLEMLTDLRDVVLVGDLDAVRTILADRNVCVDLRGLELW